jgi:hypothetical protein
VTSPRTHNPSHNPWTWVRIPASPIDKMENNGPLDGRKYNKNNRDIPMGKVKPKILKKNYVMSFFCKITKHD